nr:unnamed protein product [Digitaria exilis]
MWIHEEGHRREGPAEDDEEGSIEELFGQLWLIPNSSSTSRKRRQEVRVEEAPLGGLVWIRRSLWESKEFSADDCHPVRKSDKWSDPPKNFNFAKVFWGQGKKPTFLQAAMASRGRGRGRGFRPPNPDGDWGWGNWRQPPPPPPFYQQVPPPYAFVPNQPPPFQPPPLHATNQQQHQGFPRPYQQHSGPKQRLNNQGTKPKGQQQMQQQSQQQRQPPPQSDQPKPDESQIVEEIQNKMKEQESATEEMGHEKTIFCYNCGAPDHYSSTCEKPRVCFICGKKDHMVGRCPEWMKPQRAAQYYGSANHGLGFLHVDCAMELEEKEEEEIDNDMEQNCNTEEESELINLPEEWVYSLGGINAQEEEHIQSRLKTKNMGPETENQQEEVKMGTEDEQAPIQAEKTNPDQGEQQQLDKHTEENKPEKANKKWGPIQAEKKSSRVVNDGRTALEKAQNLKRKVNLEDNQG